jgi:hypothetical protein
MADNVPARLLPTLKARYARQLHGISIPITDFFQFNTTWRHLTTFASAGH